jgi:hypothetical protein
LFFSQFHIYKHRIYRTYKSYKSYKSYFHNVRILNAACTM